MNVQGPEHPVLNTKSSKNILIAIIVRTRLQDYWQKCFKQYQVLCLEFNLPKLGGLVPRSSWLENPQIELNILDHPVFKLSSPSRPGSIQ